ncbi:MAG: hypothetical protein DRI93_04415 [Aquificota bacterium]|nr:MAG: hypothetical protein DRI93_04415 [Aquificota bacterium]
MDDKSLLLAIAIVTGGLCYITYMLSPYASDGGVLSLILAWIAFLAGRISNYPGGGKKWWRAPGV